MYLKLDIRSKIILLLLANILMFKKMSTYEHLFIAIIFSLLIALTFSVNRAVRIFSIYVFFTIYQIFISKHVTINFIDNFLLLSSLMFKTIYFPICAGIVLVGSSKVSELISFLRTIRVPKSMIIVLAVIFRFFPVMLDDYSRIKNSLMMKGIGSSKFYYVKHPLQFMEYVFVPYVVISTNIANELSISCLCRGIDNENKATSIQILKFRTIDYLFILLLAIISVIVFVYM